MDSLGASRRSRLYLPSCCPVEVSLERCQTPVRHQGQRCHVLRSPLVAGTSSENQRSRGLGTRVFSDGGTASMFAVMLCAATYLIHRIGSLSWARSAAVSTSTPRLTVFRAFPCRSEVGAPECPCVFSRRASRNAFATGLRPAQVATFVERGTRFRPRLGVRDAADARRRCGR